MLLPKRILSHFLTAFIKKSLGPQWKTPVAWWPALLVEVTLICIYIYIYIYIYSIYFIHIHIYPRYINFRSKKFHKFREFWPSFRNILLHSICESLCSWNFPRFFNFFNLFFQHLHLKNWLCFGFFFLFEMIKLNMALMMLLDYYV